MHIRRKQLKRAWASEGLVVALEKCGGDITFPIGQLGRILEGISGADAADMRDPTAVAFNFAVASHNTAISHISADRRIASVANGEERALDMRCSATRRPLA